MLLSCNLYFICACKVADIGELCDSISNIEDMISKLSARRTIVHERGAVEKYPEPTARTRDLRAYRLWRTDTPLVVVLVVLSSLLVLVLVVLTITSSGSSG